MNRRQQLSNRRHFVIQWFLDNFRSLVDAGRKDLERTSRKFDQARRLIREIDFQLWLLWSD